MLTKENILNYIPRIPKRDLEMMWNRIEKVLNQEEIMITITKRDFDKRTALGREDLARQVLATKGVDPNNYITISHMGKGCVWTYIFREKL